VAGLVLSGRIVAIGTNSLKTEPLQARFAVNPHRIFGHAETLAIKRAMNRVPHTMLQRAVLYVVRLKQAGPQDLTLVRGLAAPCDGCRGVIKSVRIPTIIYTTDHHHELESMQL
jgi:tRNA(Arg) A34 adenosine deaminase TadA